MRSHAVLKLVPVPGCTLEYLGRYSFVMGCAADPYIHIPGTYVHVSNVPRYGRTGTAVLVVVLDLQRRSTAAFWR